MKERQYSAQMRRVWGKQIDEAEEMVRKATSGSVPERYEVALDPEDFLDLCAGFWHGLVP